MTIKKFLKSIPTAQILVEVYMCMCVFWFFIIYFLFHSFPFYLPLFCTIIWVFGLECHKSRQFCRATVFPPFHVCQELFASYLEILQSLWEE